MFRALAGSAPELPVVWFSSWSAKKVVVCLDGGWDWILLIVSPPLALCPGRELGLDTWIVHLLTLAWACDLHNTSLFPGMKCFLCSWIFLPFTNHSLNWTKTCSDTEVVPTIGQVLQLSNTAVDMIYASKSSLSLPAGLCMCFPVHPQNSWVYFPSSQCTALWKNFIPFIPFFQLICGYFSSFKLFIYLFISFFLLWPDQCIVFKERAGTTQRTLMEAIVFYLANQTLLPRQSSTPFNLCWGLIFAKVKSRPKCE